MLAKVVRIAALVVTAACYLGTDSSPQYPQKMQAPSAAEEAVYVCTQVRTEKTAGSFCFPTQERCDAERSAAAKDGAQATSCQPLAPVSCFQLGNNPSPDMETCAETADDCDLLRLIDKDKNGTTGAPCQWRHGPGTAPGKR